MNTESVFRIILLTIFTLLIIIRIYYRRKAHRSGGKFSLDKESIALEGRLSVALRIILFFCGIVVTVFYTIYPPWMVQLQLPFPAWLRWIGVILGVLSLLLLIWIQHVLGKHWSPNLQLTEHHTLVKIGPYRLVRHPMYTALFTLMISFSLLSANLLILLLSILVIFVLQARISKEETMLLNQFGDEYRVYINRTGRLLPRLIKKTALAKRKLYKLIAYFFARSAHIVSYTG